MSTIDIKPTASLIVDQITDSGGNVPNFLDGFTVGGRYLDDSANDSGSTRYLRVIDSSGPPTDSAVFPGLMWYWDSNEYLSIYVSSQAGWRTMKGTIVSDVAAGTTWYGDRGLMFYSLLTHDQVDYFDITTTGNASDFGDLYNPNDRYNTAASNNVRAMIHVGSGATDMQVMSIGTPGNSSTWMSALNPNDVGNTPAAIGDKDKAFWAGGTTGSTNAIHRYDYLNNSEATDFGDLINSPSELGGSNNDTRGLWCGGFLSSSPWTMTNVIQYITMATSGNAADLSNYTTTSMYLSVGVVSNGERAVWAGGFNGSSYMNQIAYKTIDTTANAFDFGDLSQSAARQGACSNDTRGIFAGSTQPDSTRMDYITIAYSGNASDFGDLQSNNTRGSGCSGDAA
jgi:hypothetical protein